MSPRIEPELSSFAKKHRDFIVLSILALVVVALFVSLSFRLIDQEDKHVSEVEKTHVGQPFKQSVDDVENESDASIRELLEKDPHIKKGNFRTMGITNRSMPYIGRMSNLTELDLSHTKITGDGLRHLSKLTKLDELNLSNISMDDSGLANIGALKKLKRLDLSNTQITDAGLPTLSNFPFLGDLNLSETQVSDRGIENLLALHELRKLTLSTTNVTDHALGVIAQMKSVDAINLDGTAVTGQGVAKAFEKNDLSRINLGNCRVYDADITKIVHSMPRLKNIGLAHTEVTDRSLKELAKLNRLEVLEIWGCQRISSAAILSLHAALPKCDIRMKPAIRAF